MTAHTPQPRQIPDPFKEWARKQLEQTLPGESSHRCGNCFGPLGKSAIPCKNEPKRGN